MGWNRILNQTKRIRPSAFACGAAILASATAQAANTDITWDWVLSDDAMEVATGLDYLGVDGFDTPASAVAHHAAHGTRMWCYLSVGTLEDWRPDLGAFEALDAATGEPSFIGDVYDEWPDETWLDAGRFALFMPLMEARLDMCAAKGFALVEFDNVDAFDNDTGFDISRAQQVAYLRALAAATHARGMGAILKNVPDLTAELAPEFDLLLLEDCVLNGTCASATPFLAAGKPALNAEYPENYDDEPFDAAAICGEVAAAGISGILKRATLDGHNIPCQK